MLLLTGRKILIVEDDLQEIKNLESVLRTLKLKYTSAQTVEKAKRLLNEEAFDFLLSDLHIETVAGTERPDGLSVIQFARENQPNLVIVATSNDPRADIWNEALAAGAQHFIRKPILGSQELVIALGLAKERKDLLLKNQDFSEDLKRWGRYALEYPYGIVIDQLSTNKAKGLAKRHELPCVITGETGTGKEEFARLVHRLRCQQGGQVPFIAVNCATITQSLAESLLFGHSKGSFTGADQTTSGYVADADGGILFLDEIHTLDMSIQKKLLRVLADGSYNRLGETKTHISKFQLIAASTRDLDDEVDEGRFLLDLRTRIMGLELELKPLRERKEDIPPLLSLFAAKKSLKLSATLFTELCEFLGKFYWRGNIRQLFRAVESWIVQAEFQEIPLAVTDFPVYKGMLAPQEENSLAKGKFPSQYQMDLEKILLAMTQNGDFVELTDNFEKLALKMAIDRHDSIADCGKSINLPRSTLDAKRRKYQI